jgi:hypothetical protein
MDKKNVLFSHISAGFQNKAYQRTMSIENLIQVPLKLVFVVTLHRFDQYVESVQGLLHLISYPFSLASFVL